MATRTNATRVSLDMREEAVEDRLFGRMDARGYAMVAGWRGGGVARGRRGRDVKSEKRKEEMGFGGGLKVQRGGCQRGGRRTLSKARAGSIATSTSCI